MAPKSKEVLSDTDTDDASKIVGKGKGKAPTPATDEEDELEEDTEEDEEEKEIRKKVSNFLVPILNLKANRLTSIHRDYYRPSRFPLDRGRHLQLGQSPRARYVVFFLSLPDEPGCN
jgi:hypothetical protein